MAVDISPPFTSDISNGIIFNDDEQVWLGLYEGGTVREFNTLTDYEGVYSNLEETKMVFVEMRFGLDDQVWITDICIFEIGSARDDGEPADNFGDVGVPEMLEQMNFPGDESDLIFQAFLTETRKAN